MYPRHHDLLEVIQKPHPRISMVPLPGCSAALHRAAGRKPNDGSPNKIVLYDLHQGVVHNDLNGLD